jgi:hypothetical protein
MSAMNCLNSGAGMPSGLISTHNDRRFLGVPWQYEPEGYELTSGDWYLPDFLVHLWRKATDVAAGHV